MKKFVNFKQKNTKKCTKKVIFATIIVFFCFMTIPINFCFANAMDSSDLASSIETETDSQLNMLDFSDIDKLLEGLDDSGSLVFGTDSFFVKIKNLLSGSLDSSTSFLNIIMEIIFGNLSKYIPLIATIVAISILGGIIDAVKPLSKNGSLGALVHFAIYGIVLIIVGTALIKVTTSVQNVVQNLQSQINGLLPILLTLLSGLGGNISVSLYEPAVAILSSVMIAFFNFFLLPLFLFSVVLSIVSNFSPTIKLNKFVSFINSLFRWSVGLVFTLFMGFLSIQGISAGTVDGLSIRTAKYAIRSYVPIVGSYLSDGFNIILASTGLIKNAVGVAGIILVLATILSPVLELVLFMMSLKLMAGIIEPLGDHNIACMLSDISKSLSLLIAIIVSISFSYIIMIGLIMCTANL